MDALSIEVFPVAFLIKELCDVWPRFVYDEFSQNNKNTNLYSIQYNKEQRYDFHFHHKLCVTVKYNYTNYSKFKIKSYSQ